MTEGYVAWTVLLAGLAIVAITVMTGLTTPNAFDANGNPVYIDTTTLLRMP